MSAIHRKTRIRLLGLDALGTLFKLRQPIGVHYKQVLSNYYPQLEPATDETYQRSFRASLTFQQRHYPCYGVHSNKYKEGKSRGWWLDLIAQVLKQANPALSGSTNPRAMHSVLNDIYQYYSTKEAYDVFPDTWELLRRLRAERPDLRLMVVSNNDARLPHILQDLGLSEYMNGIFDAESMGLEKPDPEAFRTAIRWIQHHDTAFHDHPLQPHEIMFVGDDEERDCLVPRNQLSWHAYQIKRQSAAHHHDESRMSLRSLTHVLDVI